MHLKLKLILYFLALSGFFSVVFAWDPAPSYRECANVARRAAHFSPAQLQSWSNLFYLTNVASGRVQVHTRLRVCGELGYTAGQALIKLDYIQMGRLYEEARVLMPDYHLGMSYTYTRGGELTPALALDWASGVRVNTTAHYYAGRERDRDPTGQVAYGVADVAGIYYLGLPVSDALSLVFGSAEWENEIYTYQFDLSSAANVRRLAGEPVELLVRNSHGKLGTRDFSFASFR